MIVVLQITDLLYIKYASSGTCHDSKYKSNYWMETMRAWDSKGMSNATGRKWEM